MPIDHYKRRYYREDQIYHGPAINSCDRQRWPAQDFNCLIVGAWKTSSVMFFEEPITTDYINPCS
jgi:hypothetical protein